MLLLSKEQVEQSVVLEEGGGEILHHQHGLLLGEASQRGCIWGYSNSRHVTLQLHNTSREGKLLNCSGEFIHSSNQRKQNLTDPLIQS